MLKINKALVHYKQIWSTDSRKYGALPNRIHKFNNWKAFRSRPCRSRYLITDLSVMKMITSPGMSAYSFSFRRRQFAIMWHRVATQCDRSSPADLQVSMCGTLFAGLLSHFVCREEGTTILLCVELAATNLVVASRYRRGLPSQDYRKVRQVDACR